MSLKKEIHEERMVWVRMKEGLIGQAGNVLTTDQQSRLVTGPPKLILPWIRSQTPAAQW